MKIKIDLPDPTLELAKGKIREFDRDNNVLESGLKQLVDAFPKNLDLGQILVKVSAINALYSTSIFGLFEVAKVIREVAIDPLLENGDPRAVSDIARVNYSGKTRWNYSFASKYCSWHRPEMYPIFDSRVDFCLRSYQARDHFAKFTQNDLWNYETFREIMKQFKEHYGLESLSTKEVDKFLYQLGNGYFAPRDIESAVESNVVLEPESEGRVPHS